ncbi:hypothetical protein NL676_010531 [Syzygium grande]|nr:hypothetical protein NL676_010531 [Syzygium grande]
MLVTSNPRISSDISEGQLTPTPIGPGAGTVLLAPAVAHPFLYCFKRRLANLRAEWDRVSASRTFARARKRPRGVGVGVMWGPA